MNAYRKRKTICLPWKWHVYKQKKKLFFWDLKVECKRGERIWTLPLPGSAVGMTEIVDSVGLVHIDPFSGDEVEVAGAA
jgi:hypothetical protein